MRACGWAPPLRRRCLSNDTSSKHGAEGSRCIVCQLPALEQPPRGPSVNANGQVLKTGAPSGHLARLTGSPHLEEHRARANECV
eukprot:4909841-Alexandrium_andersonii.AAC.1